MGVIWYLRWGFFWIGFCCDAGFYLCKITLAFGQWGIFNSPLWLYSLSAEESLQFESVFRREETATYGFEEVKCTSLDEVVRVFSPNDMIVDEESSVMSTFRWTRNRCFNRCLYTPNVFFKIWLDWFVFFSEYIASKQFTFLYFHLPLKIFKKKKKTPWFLMWSVKSPRINDESSFRNVRMWIFFSLFISSWLKQRKGMPYL